MKADKLKIKQYKIKIEIITIFYNYNNYFRNIGLRHSDCECKK